MTFALLVAAGFAVPEQGAAALGQANSVVARADDSSAAYYNPAGLAGQDGFRILLGDTLIAPAISADFPSGKSYSATSGPFFPPQIYASYGGESWGAGVAFNAPFGLGLSWPDPSAQNQFPGRYDTRAINLQTVEIAPAAGVKLGGISFGASIRYVRAAVDYQQAINFYSKQDGLAELAGAGNGVGASLSVLAPLMQDTLTLGLTYRSRATVNIDGHVHYSNVPGTFQGYIHDGGGHATFTYPDQVFFGAAYKINADLTAFAQLDYTAWQTFGAFDVALDAYCAPGGPCQKSIHSPRRWTHGFTGRLGGEYRFAEKYRARAGVLYDQGVSPTDTLSPSLPDSSRLGFSIGAGADLPAGLAADLGIAYILGQAITATDAVPATYHANALLVGLAVTYGGRGHK